MDFNEGFEEYLDIKVSLSNLLVYEDKTILDFIPIETHPCSDAELGIDNS